MTSMRQAKLTGKRRSMDIKEMDYPAKIVPLVPDIPSAQKAIIQEELIKSLALAETRALTKTQSLQTIQSRPQEGPTRTESKTQKLGRKLKGLFFNDQTPSRSQSLDVHNSSNRTLLHEDDIDEDDLYRFDKRSKYHWAGTGI